MRGLEMRELGSAQPTAVELEILRILWDLGPSPVRAVHAKLSASKGTNYSTTVKMLSVMLTKGLVKRNESATPHVWRAAITRKRAAKKFLTELIEKVYDGSAMSLVLQALSSGKASQQEIHEARRLLDQLEGKS
jgi:BlaI family transcriptional regulator, penicillinase repressor